jgi:hypothetical protein
MRGKLQDAPDAIRKIREAGIPVQERAFGFSLEHPEWSATGRSFAECACEHNGSIVLAVRADELPPIVHFWRFDILEMSAFVIAAYRRVSPESNSAGIVAAMRSEDSSYDYDALDARLDQWERDFDNYCRHAPNE